MYPVMIVTFLAAIYMAMMAPKTVYEDAVTDAPNQSTAQADVVEGDQLGADLALFGQGVQNMVTRLLQSPQGQIDLGEQMTAGAGVWTVTWPNIRTFLNNGGNGNDYRLTLVSPAVPTADALRASFFQPGYATKPGFEANPGTAGPWRAMVVQRTDGGGLGLNDVSAILVYADVTLAGFRPGNKNMGAMVGGMLRILKQSALVGMVGNNNEMIARGYINTHTLVGTNWQNTGIGAAQVAGLPAAIPAGTPIHVICMRLSVTPEGYCS